MVIAMALTASGSQEKIHLDALPYLDSEYDDPAVQAMVKKLINEEMAQMEPRDYLAHLPPPPDLANLGKSFSATTLATEMSRLAAGKEQTISLDTTRLECRPPPPELARDSTAWRKTVDNTRAQLEHQHGRMDNLELLQQYGPQAWLQQNAALKTMRDVMVAKAEAAQSATEEVNVKRKAEQLQAAPRLAQLMQAYSTSLDENQQLEFACVLLEGDIKRLRGTATQDTPDRSLTEDESATSSTAGGAAEGMEGVQESSGAAAAEAGSESSSSEIQTSRMEE